MRHRPFRNAVTVAALGLISLATAAACTSASGQPRPAPTPTTAPSPARTVATPVPAQPTSTPATGAAERPARVVVPAPPPAPPPCPGAVPSHLDASYTGRPRPTLCMTSSDVLRLEALGPGNLWASSWDKIACFYEDGVHVCRLVETGTVQFKITNASQTRPLTLVVAKASSPPKPSSACEPAATYGL